MLVRIIRKRPLVIINSLFLIIFGLVLYSQIDLIIILTSSTPRSSVSIHTPDAVYSRSSSAVTLLCWISTFPSNIDKALRVEQEWGRDCDKFLIMSAWSAAVHDNHQTVHYLHSKGDYQSLWMRTIEALNIINKHGWVHDFVLKADDDTFVNTTNLRAFLSRFSADQPLFLGHPLQKESKEVFMSGGAGYIMSKAAFASLMLELNKTLSSVPKVIQSLWSVPEDVLMGRLMARTGAKFVGAIDTQGCTLMLPIHVFDFNNKLWPQWYHLLQLAEFSQPCGLDQDLISWHYHNK